MISGRSVLYISLDFELFWGRNSGYKYSNYDRYKYGLVHEVVPRLLDLFCRYQISASWATVGLLAIESLEELNIYKPDLRPQNNYGYANNYKLFEEISKNGHLGNWVNGDKLIRLISKCPNQEIASHTFAHIFCNEDGVSDRIISDDIKSCKRLFKDKYDIELNSLVFPYNQIPNLNNLDIDIKYIRTDNVNELYQNNKIRSYRRPVKRALRWLDRYVNITGQHQIKVKETGSYIFVPESRFLPPSIGGASAALVLKRIKCEMKFAAQSGSDYHLWWHPHNFTVNMSDCLKNLEEILKYYVVLIDEFQMHSLCMNQAHEKHC